MEPKKIAIIGGSIWGNRGASAMLETTIGKLREAKIEAEYAVFTPYPLKDSKLVDDPQMEFLDSRPLALIQYFLKAVWGWLLARFGQNTNFSGGVKLLTSADVLLDIGGITFSDGRLMFLPYNILTIWPSIMFRVPVVKLSQAAGSFKNPIIRLFSKLFLSRCNHFFARGEKTLAFLKELGIDTKKINLAADIAFCYEPRYCLSTENSTAINQLCDSLDKLIISGKKVVVISPSILVLEKMKTRQPNYVQLLVDFIKQIDSNDIVFIVFPNASREGSKKKRNNDIRAIELLRDAAEIQLPSPLYKRIKWVAFDVNTRGIEEIIKRADILLASRFHAMVFGLRLGIPTMVLGWGHKYLEVMKKFGQEGYVTDFESPNANLAKNLLEVLEKKKLIEAEIGQALVAEKASSNQQFDYLIRSIFDK